MTQQYSALPNYRQAIQERGTTDRAWYSLFSDLWNRKPPSAESAVSVGTSPFTYTAVRGGFVIVQGGTVSLVQFSRDGLTNHTTGATQGCFPLSQGDSLIVTYSVAPSMTFVPQ